MTSLHQAPKALAMAAVVALLPAAVCAEPTSPPLLIAALRPYIGTNIVYLETALPHCETTVFAIDLSKPNGREAYALALAAALAKQAVKIEVVNATGCAGWGTHIQSLYLINN